MFELDAILGFLKGLYLVFIKAAKTLHIFDYEKKKTHTHTQRTKRFNKKKITKIYIWECNSTIKMELKFDLYVWRYVVYTWAMSALSHE